MHMFDLYCGKISSFSSTIPAGQAYLLFLDFFGGRGKIGRPKRRKQSKEVKADECGQGEGGGQKIRIYADVICVWPLKRIFNWYELFSKYCSQFL